MSSAERGRRPGCGREIAGADSFFDDRAELGRHFRSMISVPVIVNPGFDKPRAQVEIGSGTADMVEVGVFGTSGSDRSTSNGPANHELTGPLPGMG